jgi:hypothetical protein
LSKEKQYLKIKLKFLTAAEFIFDVSGRIDLLFVIVFQIGYVTDDTKNRMVAQERRKSLFFL